MLLFCLSKEDRRSTNHCQLPQQHKTRHHDSVLSAVTTDELRLRDDEVEMSEELDEHGGTNMVNNVGK